MGAASVSAPAARSASTSGHSTDGQGPTTTARPRVTSGAAAVGPRGPSLTAELSAAQARASHAPDVARQAIKELNVLAGELSALAGELESSGLARIHASAYFDLLQRYAALARAAWLSVAAERLEQDGSNPDYRQQAIAIARETTRLRRECEVVASNADFTLPRRVPWRWRRRARLVRSALRAWQGALTVPADPKRMGVALYDLRGALYIALTGGLELTLLDSLSSSARWLVTALAVASAASLAGSALADNPTHAASYAVLTSITLIGLTAMILLLARNLGALPETLAGASFSETGSGLNGWQGSRFTAGALRVWWDVVGVVGALAGLTGLAVGVLFVIQSPLTHGLAVAIQQGGLAALAALPPANWLLLIGGLLEALLTPVALATALAVVALALPALIVTTWRFAGELGGWRRWSPGARRYALGPALSVIAWLAGALVGLAWYLSGLFNLDSITVAQFGVSGTPITISARVFALLAALTLPWLALIEIPFRIGLSRWRGAWLRDLTTRKNATESHVRRLSAPDPHTGAQDTSEETLRMMQYDLVLLQFYTGRIEEAERASSLPLSLPATLTLALYMIVAALLLDAGSSALVHALQGAIGL
jgi:hypothetical protein